MEWREKIETKKITHDIWFKVTGAMGGGVGTKTGKLTQYFVGSDGETLH